MKEKDILIKTGAPEEAPPAPPTDEDRISLVARSILSEHIAAFLELAK